MRRPANPLRRSEWIRLATLTLAAAGVFVVVRRLPTGTNLDHLDFQAPGQSSVQLCDPGNPQFQPVMEVPSPVEARLEPAAAVTGSRRDFVLLLRTATGKPVGPADLLVSHTRKLHLMVVDPSLRDYQHIHPEPGDASGQWRFSLTPRLAGTYRVFADFVPAATGRNLYAVAEFAVPGAAAEPLIRAVSGPLAAQAAEIAGVRIQLSTIRPEIRAGETTELELDLVRADGGPVRLGTVMGAYAHAVGFDEQRSGFAHLHPQQVDRNLPPDLHRPHLTFKVQWPRPGRYAVWVQLELDGREVFVPFVLAAD